MEKKNSSSWIVVVLVIAVIIGAVAFVGSFFMNNTREPVVADGVCYTPQGDGWSISLTEDFSGSELTVNAIFDGKRVNSFEGLSGSDTLKKLTVVFDGNDSKIDKNTFGKMLGITELTLVNENGAKLEIAAKAFDGCTDLKSLTFSGASVICKGESLPCTAAFEELAFRNGSVKLERDSMRSGFDPVSLVFDNVEFDSEWNSGFYHLNVDEITVRGSNISLSVYALLEFYPTIKAETLFLGEGGYVTAEDNVKFPIDRLVIEEGFDFSNGGASMKLHYGLLDANVRNAPIASEITIPVSVTSIPAGFFGDEDECIVYYGGLSENFDTVFVDKSNNSALFNGLVTIYGLESSDFKVIFDSLGGSPTETQTVKYGETVSCPQDPSREGFVFAGWYTDPTEGRVWDFASDKIMGETRLYAHWIDLLGFEECEILDVFGFTLMNDGADGYYYAMVDRDENTKDIADSFNVSEYATVKVRAENGSSDLPLSALPLEDGENRFVMTVTSGNGQNHKTYSLVIFRKYLCRVIFDDGVSSDTVEVEVNSMLEARSAEREGYSFVGWYLGDTEWDFTARQVTESITLKAIWEPCKYTVTLEGYGDTTVTYGESFTLNVPEKVGCTFNGWRLSDGAFVTDNEGRSLTPWTKTSGAILVADYSVRSYKISYENTKGSPNANPVSFGADRELVLVGLSADGYIFKGWYKDGAAVSTIPSGQEGDVVLTAVWEPIIYKITYENVGDVTFSAPQTYTVEDSFVLPSLSMNGYTFMGWQLNGKTVEAIEEGTVGDLRLVAAWKGIIYPITYLNIEEATHNNPSSYEYGVGLSLVDPVKEGYKFLGWYNGEKAITEISASCKGEMIISAAWEAIKYTVNFYDVNRNLIYTETVEHGKAVKNAPVPSTVYHKLFVNWSEDINLVKGDLEVYPVYKDHTYSVTFDSCGGTEVDDQIVFYGEIPTRPDDPTNGDVRFDAWYLPDGSVYDFTYPLNRDITLNAGWLDYTPIYTAEDFAAMEGSQGKFRLMNNVSFYNETFTVIKSFSGTLDGGGFTVSAFSLEGSGDLAMILENSGTIKNLTVKKASVQQTLSAHNTSLAIFVLNNKGVIENCRLEDCSFGMVKPKTVRAKDSGLICAVNSGVIRDCTVVNSTVNLNWSLNTNDLCYYSGGSTSFGGIVGRNDGGELENCRAAVSINFTSPQVNNDKTYDSGSTSKMLIGAVAGTSSGNVKQCSADMSMTCSASGGYAYTDARIGAIAGEVTDGIIENCVSVCDVDLDHQGTQNRLKMYVGGCCGYVENGADVKNCMSYGSVSRNNISVATNHIGGFVAYNAGNVRNSYSFTALAVENDASVAGFCDTNTTNGTIRSCFASGYFYVLEGISPEAFVNSNSGSVLDCYFDEGFAVVEHSERSSYAIDSVANGVSLETFCTEGFLSDTLYWNASVWNTEDGRLPYINGFASMVATVDRYELGSIEISDKAPKIGETVTLTAKPFETFRFIGWYRKGSDEMLSSEEAYSMVVADGISLPEARFAKKDLKIYTYDDLLKIDKYNLKGSKVEFMNSINCMGEALPMIEEFHGIMNGNGFSIYNFASTLSSSGDVAFIRNNYGEIRDLTLSGSILVYSGGGESRITFFVANNHESGIIEDCVALGKLKIVGEQKYTNQGSALTVYGGAFAAQNAGTIKNCGFVPKVEVSGLNDGIVFDVKLVNRMALNWQTSATTGSTLYSGFVTGYNTGTVSDCNSIGAQLGSVEEPARFENNLVMYHSGYTSWHISGTSYMNVFAGGITGYNAESGSVARCIDSSVMYVSDLTGTDIWNEYYDTFAGVHKGYLRSNVNFGGISGVNEGILENDLSEGIITYNSDNINRMSANNADLMSGLLSNIGGISGINTGTVRNASHKGILIVTAAHTVYAGAISGDNNGTVSNCYGGGIIMAEGISDSEKVYLSLRFWQGFGGSRYRHGSVSVGGMVGRNANGATISNCLSNYRFDEMNNCAEESDYLRLVNVLLIPVHVKDAFFALFEKPPVYANVLQVGTIVGNGQNLGNIQNCYYVKNGEYDYKDGEMLVDDCLKLTDEMISEKLYWSITSDPDAEGEYDWLVTKGYYSASSGDGGDSVLLATISLIPMALSVE